MEYGGILYTIYHMPSTKKTLGGLQSADRRQRPQVYLSICLMDEYLR